MFVKSCMPNCPSSHCYSWSGHGISKCVEYLHARSPPNCKPGTGYRDVNTLVSSCHIEILLYLSCIAQCLLLYITLILVSLSTGAVVLEGRWSRWSLPLLSSTSSSSVSVPDAMGLQQLATTLQPALALVERHPVGRAWVGLGAGLEEEVLDSGVVCDVTRNVSGSSLLAYCTVPCCKYRVSTGFTLWGKCKSHRGQPQSAVTSYTVAT